MRPHTTPHPEKFAYLTLSSAPAMRAACVREGRAATSATGHRLLLLLRVGLRVRRRVDAVRLRLLLLLRGAVHRLLRVDTASRGRWRLMERSGRLLLRCGCPLLRRHHARERQLLAPGTELRARRCGRGGTGSAETARGACSAEGLLLLLRWLLLLVVGTTVLLLLAAATLLAILFFLQEHTTADIPLREVFRR